MLSLAVQLGPEAKKMKKEFWQIELFEGADKAVVLNSANEWLREKNPAEVQVSYSESASTYHSRSLHGDAVYVSKTIAVAYR
jgi:hypothetical protein